MPSEKKASFDDYGICVVDVQPRLFAAAEGWAKMSDVGEQITAALGKAYAFVEENGVDYDLREKTVVYRTEPGKSFETDGCAIFCGPFVKVSFKAGADIRPDTTPGGKAVTVRHIGSYDRLHLAHDAIHQWSAKTGTPLKGLCWDVYGEGSDDESRLVTDVYYQL